jgi:hypothetical protein
VGVPVALLALGACAQAPAPPAAQLFTVFDIEALYAGGATADSALAADTELPGGIPIGHILDGTTESLFQRPALIEAHGGSYLTTEIWVRYAQVWMQPMYVPVTGWVDGVPQKLLGGDGLWHPVFSVGPASGFYSPFWQAMYFTVPPGTTTATYTSAKQILDAGFALVPGDGWTIPIVPQDAVPPAGLASPTREMGWLDGAKVFTLDFGEGLFTWNAATNVVGETPLYVMVTRDASGNLVAPYLPTVGGLGPVGSHVAAAPTVGGEPIYASYWRLYTVEIPTTARVVADDALQQALDAAGLHDLGFPADPNVAYDTPSIVGRVVVNPTGCTVMDPADTRFNCTFLDSEVAIETNVESGAIQPTEITATCPFVTWNETSLLTPIVE